MSVPRPYGNSTVLPVLSGGFLTPLSFRFIISAYGLPLRGAPPPISPAPGSTFKVVWEKDILASPEQACSQPKPEKPTWVDYIGPKPQGNNSKSTSSSSGMTSPPPPQLQAQQMPIKSSLEQGRRRGGHTQKYSLDSKEKWNAIINSPRT